jgi:hypothetical protein
MNDLQTGNLHMVNQEFTVLINMLYRYNFLFIILCKYFQVIIIILKIMKICHIGDAKIWKHKKLKS